MAIKPKSRAHEDRIKALESESKWNEAMRHALVDNFTRLDSELRAEIAAMKETVKQNQPGKWWQFWK